MSGLVELWRDRTVTIDQISNGDKTMKYKVMAFLLALTMMSWAQSATTSQSAATEAKSGCACCEKMSSAEDKDGKSGRKKENRADRCAKGKCWKGKERKGCPGKEGKKAKKCCEGMQCSRDSHHAS